MSYITDSKCYVTDSDVERNMKTTNAIIDMVASQFIEDGYEEQDAEKLAYDMVVKRRNYRPVLSQSNFNTVESAGNSQNGQLLCEPRFDMMTLPNGKLISRVMDRSVAGISFEQAQAENYEEIKDNREITRKEKEMELELSKKEREYTLEEHHNERIKAIRVPVGFNFTQPNSVESNFIGEQNVDSDLAKLFVQRKNIVRKKKKRDTDEGIIYMWDAEDKIYIQVSLTKLRTELKEFYYKELSGKGSLVDNKVAEVIDRVRFNLAPVIEKSGLKISDGNQTFFLNGYYDIKTGEFNECDTSGIFHTFCMTYDFDKEAPNPDKFEEILSQIFDGDTNKITLTYQIIGALISDVRSLKYIYVFQGVTNSGKTTLATIILRLVHTNERKKLNTVNEITTDVLKALAKSVKIVCIKDSGHEALKVNSVSYLKSYTAGDLDEEDIYFTMLLQTNNPIYSDKYGNIEEALHDRLLVLPFEKNLRKATEDNRSNVVEDFLENHFEREKQGIARKALEAIHAVMSNGKRFACEFPLNGCVGGVVVSGNNLMLSEDFTKNRLELLTNFIEKNFVFVEEAFQVDPREGIEAKKFFEMVNVDMPNIFANSNSLGKALSQVRPFGKNVDKKDYSDTRYYNLSPKE